MTIPVGLASTGNTFCSVICPARRLNIATPLADLGLALLTETNSQHPSLLGIVLKGCPGSVTYETGSLPGILHCELGALRGCAQMVPPDNTTVAAIRMRWLNLFKFWIIVIVRSLSGAEARNKIFTSRPENSLADIAQCR